MELLDDQFLGHLIADFQPIGTMYGSGCVKLGRVSSPSTRADPAFSTGLTGSADCSKIPRCLLLLSAMIIAGGSADRHAQRSSISGVAWGDEALRLMVLWVTMLGAVAATRERQSYRHRRACPGYCPERFAASCCRVGRRYALYWRRLPARWRGIRQCVRG